MSIWPFRKKKLTPIDGGLVAAMREKDPELFDRIGHLSVMAAVGEWRKTYPEDIWDTMLPPGAYLIKPRKTEH